VAFGARVIYPLVVSIEKNLYTEEILSYLFWPDIRQNARVAMHEYREAALAVAKLHLPLDAKERRVVALQDKLHDKLFGLLKEQLSRVPGHREDRYTAWDGK
jgi:uncharacterized protein YceH (UPF0502 family)